MVTFKNSTRFGKISVLFMIILFAGFSVLSTGCKEKKLAQERARQELIKIQNAKTSLETVLNDKTKSLEEKEKVLNDVKSKNINDPLIKEMITKLEDNIKNQKEELKKKEEIEKQKAEAEKKKLVEKLDLKTQLVNLMTDIASAGKSGDVTTANNKIAQALQLFSSEDVPVLTIIAQTGNEKDYEQPSTAKKFLNYLKDKKELKAAIENIVLDNAGKIKELELRKK